MKESKGRIYSLRIRKEDQEAIDRIKKLAYIKSNSGAILYALRMAYKGITGKLYSKK